MTISFETDDMKEVLLALLQSLDMLPDEEGCSLLPSMSDEARWQRLCDLAIRQDVAPLLYHCLRPETSVPSWVVERLQTAYYLNTARNMNMYVQLGTALRALKEAKVPAILLKGGALAITVYPEFGLRSMGDVDLLIPKAQVDQALDVLFALGYVLTSDWNGCSLRFLRRFGNEVGLEGSGLHIDLHWQLVVKWWLRDAASIEIDELWERVEPLAVEEVDAWQLGPEDTLVYLAIHLAGHTYVGLKWYVDIDRFIHHWSGDINWPWVVERARSWDVGMLVGTALHYVQRVLGTPVPREALESLLPGKWRRRFFVDCLYPCFLETGIGNYAQRFQRNLCVAALLDQSVVWGHIIRRRLFPGREWLTARYNLTGNWKSWVFVLWYPLMLPYQWTASALRRSSSPKRKR